MIVNFICVVNYISGIRGTHTREMQCKCADTKNRERNEGVFEFYCVHQSNGFSFYVYNRVLHDTPLCF